MPPRQQSNAPRDFASCRFFGEGASYPALAIDGSQLEDDMLSDGTAAFENSARFNFGQPRTLVWHFEALGVLDSGTIYRHGTGGSLELVELIAGPPLTLRVRVNGVVVHRCEMTPATFGNMWIAWASELNPDPDAAPSEAVQSWLYIHSETGQWSERRRFLHPAKIGQATTAYVGASSSGGVGSVSEPVRTFGVFSRLLSFTELALAFWDARPSPTTETRTRRESVPLAPGTLDSPDEVHGPTAQVSAAALFHTQDRCMGALLNERFKAVPVIRETTHTAEGSAPKIGPALGSGGYRWSLGWLRAYPVSPSANALWVEVHGRAWSEDPFVGAGAWGLRLYAMTRRPGSPLELGVEGEPPEPFEFRFIEAEFFQDNSAPTDPGRWRIRGLMPLVRGSEGVARDRVYLALAYALDPQGIADVLEQADMRLEVRAAHAVQVFDANIGTPPGGGPGGESG